MSPFTGRTGAVLGSLLGALILVGCPKAESDPVAAGNVSPCTAIISNSVPPADRYPIHVNITASVFWVGEEATDENGFIHNRASAWDVDWESRFGGVDSPDEGRAGYCPQTFIPKENAFYIALPYNDVDEAGQRRAEASAIVPWFAATGAAYAKAGLGEKGSKGLLRSFVEHRWVEVTQGPRRCYGQWEDVGPYLEDDRDYVFGTAAPRNKEDPNAGIDLSPAMATCLQVDGVGIVSWRFVEVADVPAGPWSVVVTAAR